MEAKRRTAYRQRRLTARGSRSTIRTAPRYQTKEVTVPESRGGISCGVAGCLTIAVILFAVLMVLMLIVVAVRFSGMLAA